MPKRILSGTVVSNKTDKTVVVKVMRQVRHKLYKKIVRKTKKYHAHDELNKFINKRIERIKSITTTYLTSWGELFCKTYAGLNCMPRCVKELTPQLKPENVEKSDFLKVYIPSGRKELLKIPWLSDYVIRSLLIKSKDHSDKVAS